MKTVDKTMCVWEQMLCFQKLRNVALLYGVDGCGGGPVFVCCLMLLFAEPGAVWKYDASFIDSWGIL